MQILCSHVTASAETHCVIPMRALATTNVYASASTREFRVSLSCEGKKKSEHSSYNERRAYSPVIRSQPVCFLCLNMCTALCALPYLLINDLSSKTPRPFSRDHCQEKGECLLTTEITKKKKVACSRKLCDLPPLWLIKGT